MGRGSERVLPPRMVLEGARRAEVIAMVEQAAITRPAI
jgi:4-hydroxy-tetrahydrodipicolinate synthase